MKPNHDIRTGLSVRDAVLAFAGSTSEAAPLT